MKKITTFLFVFVCAVSFAHAQFSEFHGGLSLPTSHFNDDDKTNVRAGNATTGFNLGYKYYTPISGSQLFLVFSIDGYYNDLKSDFKDRIEDANKGVDIVFPKYLNFPATLGLNYTLPVNENVGIFGEASLGANCSWMTKEAYEKSGNEIFFDHDPAFGFCYGIGGGLLIQNRYTINVRYNDLGDYKYKYKSTTIVNGNKETSKDRMRKLPLTNLALAVGIRF